VNRNRAVSFYPPIVDVLAACRDVVLRDSGDQGVPPEAHHVSKISQEWDLAMMNVQPGSCCVVSCPGVAWLGVFDGQLESTLCDCPGVET
jgi:hypothetical protein